MFGEEHLAAWITLGFMIVVQAVVTTTYLARQIDRKLDFSLFDKKHEDLERRMETRWNDLERRLEARWTEIEMRLRHLEQSFAAAISAAAVRLPPTSP